MIRDIATLIGPQQMLGPAVLAADASSATFDMKGYSSLAFLISVGVGGITFNSTNKIDFVVTHSDDDSTYTNVVSAEVQGPGTISNGIVHSLTSAKAAADTAPTKVGYVGQKRYVKVTAYFSGTHGTGTPISVVGVRGNAEIKT